MIDLHTHLLPAVDDGARTVEQAAAVMTRFAAAGVTTVACTPHLRSSALRVHAAPSMDAPLAELRAQAPAGLTIVLGREVMLDDPGVPLDGHDVTLGDSRAVLVEFPRGRAPLAAARELARLRDSGLVPVLAHPERVVDATLADVQAWRDAGAVIQVDATTLCGEGSRGRLARDLVRAGAADILASDNHGDERTLETARVWLEAHGGTVAAAMLTVDNPARLLRDASCVAVPPTGVPPDGPRGALAGWLRARLGLTRVGRRATG